MTHPRPRPYKLHAIGSFRATRWADKTRAVEEAARLAAETGQVAFVNWIEGTDENGRDRYGWVEVYPNGVRTGGLS